MTRYDIAHRESVNISSEDKMPMKLYKNKYISVNNKKLKGNYLLLTIHDQYVNSLFITNLRRRSIDRRMAGVLLVVWNIFTTLFAALLKK